MRLLSFLKPASGLSQIPKCEAPGATIFRGNPRCSRHLGHPPRDGDRWDTEIPGAGCPLKYSKLAPASRGRRVSGLAGSVKVARSREGGMFTSSLLQRE